MDVWVAFTHATKWQAEGIFKCFFPCRKEEKEAKDRELAAAADNGEAPASADLTKATSQKNLPGSKKKFAHQIPLLSEKEICELAKRFADAIPEGELSVADLQGYLLKEQDAPMREMLKKEKVEKEEQERREREDEENKEKEKEEKENSSGLSLLLSFLFVQLACV
ncbi:hypothetical protein BDZ89DRAFT_1129610 [Hymenopellis radicata]|nr:hypothetical protein BDZ89DRAFT_1129610 [Hymenopellis radicata]